MDVIRWHRDEKVLIYADPPYILTTRTGGLYKDELHMTEHETLLQLLNDHPGPVLLSSLHHGLYEARLQGWEKKTYQTNCASGRRYEEVLWINPKAMELLNERDGK
jgi:DNA adenine methylase